jgi:hypothetical protein
MFERTLGDKFKTIFEVDRVKYEDPGESREQETLFIEIETSRNTIKDGRAFARVTGKASLFAQADKLPFAYFSKCIASHSELCQDVFFFDLEENSRLFQNIVQRTLSFVYFFDIQYDPEIGTITSLETEF